MTISNQPKQKYLGPKGLVVLIALLSAFVPLSTDIYLPSLPGMSAYFHVPVDQINLTLTAFFVSYSLGILIWGPLSDRYGRKPILLVGLTLYLLASAMCATAWSVNTLILFRVFQALGGSAAGAVATAVVKDVYTGKQREPILAIVQSMVLISPALAPVLGAFLLKIISWRGVFWTLTGIGGLALLGSILFEETIAVRNTGMLMQSLSRLSKVLKNRSFTMLLFLFSLGSISSLAFIASSTFIYQNGFHLSGQMYSFYFALNALGMIAGPMIYLRISRRFNSEAIIRTCFLISAVSGVLNCVLGSLQPWVFALCILPSSIAGNCMRPPAANLMLEQQKGDTGSVSSVMSCVGLLMGSLGMQIISLNWANIIIALGAMTIMTATTSFLLWPFVIKRAVRIAAPTYALVEEEA